MSKFTPGPWERNVSARYPVYAERTPGKKDWVHVAVALPCPEAEANLRLIAAAPELLEKLEWLCNIVQHPAATKASMRHIAMDCRDAIARATNMEDVLTNDQD